MFDHLTYISPAHQIALKTALKNHTFGTHGNPQLVGQLYKSALDKASDVAQGQEARKFIVTKLIADTGTISSATDTETGIYVQLVATKGSADFLLTFGQKWAMECASQATSSRAIHYW